MNNRDITDEQLVAYVDGTLDEALKSEVEAMIESSDAMKEKVEAIRKINLLLSQVSKELQNEPLPQDIQNLIESHKQQEQKETDLDKVSHEDSKKAMPQWIQSIIETILPIRMPQVMMLAACLLLGLYVVIDYQQEPIILISDENLVSGANTEIGMYEVMTLRGDNSYVDETAMESRLRSDIEHIEEEILIAVNRFEVIRTSRRDLSYDLVRGNKRLELEKDDEQEKDEELEQYEELRKHIEELDKSKLLLEEELKELEGLVDGRFDIQKLFEESKLESSVEDILERILKERRVESVVVENNLRYQVKLLKSFEAADGISCDIGQIIDPESGTLFFVACPKNNGSFSIEFTDKKPQL